MADQSGFRALMDQFKSLTKNKPFLLMNVGFILWYLLIFWRMNIPLSFEVMFASSDSLSYLSVSDWIWTGQETEFVEHRPFLFPLVILILKNIGGVFLIWLFQFVLWLISANLIFRSIEKLTKLKSLGYIGAAVFVTNFTLISLTMHALTEVLNIFLLSFLVWYFVQNFAKRKELEFILKICFIFALLTLNKPVFSIPMWMILFGIVPLFYGKLFWKKPLKLFSLLLVMSPIILQLGIMKVNYGTMTISNIGERTFERYLLTQGIQELESMDRPEALEFAHNMNPDERKDYFLKNFGAYTGVFFETIESNIKDRSIFLGFPEGTGNANLASKMKSINFYYWCLHLVFLPLAVILFFMLLFKKKHQEAIIVLSIVGLAFYYVFVTGISFFQGDRLVLGALPLWIVGYAFVGYQTIQVVRQKFKSGSVVSEQSV